jgi:hypothetical protein
MNIMYSVLGEEIERLVGTVGHDEERVARTVALPLRIFINSAPDDRLRGYIIRACGMERWLR